MVTSQRAGAVLLSAAAAAVLISACSSSASSAGNSGTSGNGSNTVDSTASTATKAPIKVMQIGTFDSAGLSLEDAKDGVSAAVAAINKAGGANGHQISMEYCNDNFNASTGAQCARQAVQDKVVAVVGAASAEASAEIPILQAAHIPWLAGTGSGGPIEQTSPISYPLTGGTQSVEVAMGRLLTTLGEKNVAVIVADAAAAYPAGDAVASGVKSGGGTSKRTLAKIGATDYSAVASAALSSKPDGVAIASVPTDAPRIILALRQAGYKGPITTLAGIVSDDAIKSLGANADNLYLLVDTVPVTSTSNSSVQSFLADMKSANLTKSVDSEALSGWTAVHFFADLVSQIGDQDVTSSAVTSTLAHLSKPISLGTVPDYHGVPSPPLVKGYPRVPTFSVYVTKVQNGKEQPYNNGEPYNPLQ